MFKIGDTVTRDSHNNDIVFTIVDIKNNVYYLKGVNIRLLADAEASDLKLCTLDEDIEQEEIFNERINVTTNFNRNDYFYLPGKILHIDVDCLVSNFEKKH